MDGASVVRVVSALVAGGEVAAGAGAAVVRVVDGASVVRVVEGVAVAVGSIAATAATVSVPSP